MSSRCRECSPYLLGGRDQRVAHYEPCSRTVWHATGLKRNHGAACPCGCALHDALLCCAVSGKNTIELCKRAGHLTSWCGIQHLRAAAGQTHGQPSHRPWFPEHPRLQGFHSRQSGTGRGRRGHRGRQQNAGRKRQEELERRARINAGWTPAAPRKPCQTRLAGCLALLAAPCPTCGVHPSPYDRPNDVHQPRQLPLQHV